MSLVPKSDGTNNSPVALVPQPLNDRVIAYIAANPSLFTGLSANESYTKCINDALDNLVP